MPYSETTVTDEVDIAQLKKLSGGSVVPVMTVGRDLYKGFESGIYKAAPAAAGAEGTPAAAPQETADTAAPK